MEHFQIILAGLTAIILFVYGLDNFSREIERIAGESFRKSLARATRLPIAGVAIGAVVTAIIQSSSATSVIVISLVNAGVLSFKNSIGVIFGSNVGTTITAQLVAFKLTAFAPIFIVIGFLLSLVRSRISVFGKAIFFFGFVFFSLNLISSSLQPLQNSPTMIAWLSQPQSPLLAILFGCLFTAAVQSSSVTTGLAIVLTQQGILGLENAVPLIMGANIGTTVTAMIAMFNMDAAAKKTALSHLLFNVGGVLLFLPALYLFGDWLSTIETDPAIALANIHLVFNLVATTVFLLLINPFSRLVDALLGEGRMDFQRLELPAITEGQQLEDVSERLDREAGFLLSFLQENYNQVTLSIETNYRTIAEAAQKRIEYVDFLKKEYLGYFAKLINLANDEQQSGQLVRKINQFDYLFQIHDSIKDLYDTKKVMSEHYIEIGSDILLLVRELSSETIGLFDDIKQAIESNDHSALREPSDDIQTTLDDVHRQMLSLMADTNRKDAGALTNFFTYSQRLKDKLINYAKIRIR